MYMKVMMLICTKKKSSSITFWTRVALIRTPHLQPINRPRQKRNLISGGNQNHCHFCSWWWKQRLMSCPCWELQTQGSNRVGCTYWVSDKLMFSHAKWLWLHLVDFQSVWPLIVTCRGSAPWKTWLCQPWNIKLMKTVILPLPGLVSFCLSYSYGQMWLIRVSCDNLWDAALRNHPRNGCCISRFNLPLVKIWPNSINTFCDKS